MADTSKKELLVTCQSATNYAASEPAILSMHHPRLPERFPTQPEGKGRLLLLPRGSRTLGTQKPSASGRSEEIMPPDHLRARQCAGNGE